MINWIETRQRFGYASMKGRRPQVVVVCDDCGKGGILQNIEIK